MERIASFCVDHTKLLPGMYLSRQDGENGEILTWDIRMKQPNKGSYLSPAAAHTLEHLFATYARNSKYSKGIVYVGPMGCLTGFYLLTIGLTPAEALDLTRSAFAWMAGETKCRKNLKMAYTISIHSPRMGRDEVTGDWYEP